VSSFVVLYRWRIDPGHEEAFVEAWSAITRRLRERVGSGGLGGSRGSRLHRGDDGLWCVYAV
jgi:heme-degrading monooxygenase HmoA